MPRKCTICNDAENVEKINKLIANGTAYRGIALQIYGDKNRHMSIIRHASNCLKLDFQTYQQQIKKGQAIDYNAETAEAMQMIKKMLYACDEWMQDPDDPNKYTLTPRSDDIKVIYDEPTKDGKSYVRKSKMLDELLDEIQGRGKKIVRVKLATNNHKLFLDTMRDINTKLDAVAKTQGQYKEKEQNPANKTPLEKLKDFWQENQADQTLHPELKFTAEQVLEQSDIDPEFQHIPRAERMKVLGITEIEGDQ